MHRQNHKTRHFCLPVPRWHLLIVVISVIALSWIGFAKPTLANGNCTNPYRVQPGDHLYQIARKFNIPIWVLFDYNPGLVYHPDLIYTGSILCLPPLTEDGNVPAVNHLDVVTEINYTYVTTETNPIRVGPQPTPPTPNLILNKRIVYRIERDQNCTVDKDPKCNIVLGSSQLNEKLKLAPKPVLVAVEQTGPPPDPTHQAGNYYLVGIGDAGKKLLSRLNFLDAPMTISSETTGECIPPTRLAEAFGADVKGATGNIVLESGNGYRHLFPLSDLQHVENWDLFQQCYDTARILFALYPSTQGKEDENVLLLLTTDPQNPGGNERYYWRGYYPNPSPWWNWGYRFWW